ncbi:MAG: D-alanine--D-alanine ligase [Oscillospiraceae bacterium]|nr:D-alanine--D-alanine ligase [Oscillospiraceae bacterium]
MKIQVAVLFGGRSVEHEISVISAVQAMESLNKETYDILPIYMTKDNEFYTGDVLRDIRRYRDVPGLLKDATRVTFAREEGRVVVKRVPAKRFGSSVIAMPDVAFPIVHGTNVEDGALQGFLRTLGIPFVGCDVLASAVGMDKYVMKLLWQAMGFPVLPALRFSAAEYSDPEGIVRQAEEQIGYPMIVKPVNLGSSVGISKASDRDGLYAALDTAFTFADTVLLEHAVTNLREINCAVLGDEDGAEASVLEEPVSTDEILSYTDKYMDNGGKGGKTGGKSAGMASLKRKIPAELPQERTEEIRSLAVRAFQALGCSGVARIDFMIDGETDKVYLNEINTIPGSLAFYLWEAAGLSYPALLDKLISLARKRARKQAGITYSFDTNVFAMGGGMGVGTKGAKGSKTGA